jgi:hypothetical protein
VDALRHPRRGFMSWRVQILPYCEQSAVWEEAVNAFELYPLPTRNPPHAGLSRTLIIYQCPDDPDVKTPQYASNLPTSRVGLASYLGVSGVDHREPTGLFVFGTPVRFGDVTDGLSNTLAVGERPPSPDFNYGWWYTGAGQDLTGNAEAFLGTSERMALPNPEWSQCPSPDRFRAGQPGDTCDTLHFWSHHPNGAHFLLGDGCVRFVSYEIGSVVLDKLATRAGGELIPEF